MMFTNPEIGIIQLASFIVIILLGFPIAFTLVAMGVFFGYYAMGSRIFNLLVTNTYDVMSNDVLTAVPLFLFMGYVVERSNILGPAVLFDPDGDAQSARARSRWRR